jgi:hypothetical protein
LGHPDPGAVSAAMPIGIMYGVIASNAKTVR